MQLCWLILAPLLFSGLAHAQLTEIADENLQEVSGQGYFNITETYDAGQQLSFQRFTMGALIGMNLNIDELKLGQYNRPYPVYNSSNCAPENGQDTGMCYSQYVRKGGWPTAYTTQVDNSLNPPGWTCTTRDCQQKKWDIDIRRLSYGTVSGGAINLFWQENPFFELAFSGTGGSRKLVGFRVGAEESHGSQSNTIGNLSGAILPRVDAGLAVLDLNVSGARTTGHANLPSSQIGGTWFHNLLNAQANALAVSPPAENNWYDHMKGFFISLQDRAVTYPSVRNETTYKTLPGFWMNLGNGLNTQTSNANHPVNHFTPVNSPGSGAVLTGDNHYGQVYWPNTQW